MKVKDLIKELKKVDPERLVIMARDGEGNSYTPLAGFWEGKYRPESTYSGEVGMERLTELDKKHGYTQEDVMRGGKKAIILKPTY